MNLFILQAWQPVHRIERSFSPRRGRRLMDSLFAMAFLGAGDEISMSLGWLEPFAVLGVSVVLFLTERIRPDVVALATGRRWAGIGALTPEEAFSGSAAGRVKAHLGVHLAWGLTPTPGVSDQAAGSS
jgi:hypothetical protein